MNPSRVGHWAFRLAPAALVGLALSLAGTAAEAPLGATAHGQDLDAADAGDAAPSDASISPPGPLAVTGVMPAEATARTQARLTILGSGFSAGVAQVLIGNLDTSDLYVPDDGRLLCTTTLMPADLYDVTVVMDDGRESTQMAALRFVDEMPYPAPIVLDLEPSVLAAGESFVVTGAAFDDGARVEFEGPAAPLDVTVTRVDTSELQVDLPRRFPAGIWTVRVVNPDGQHAVADGVLSVTPAPDTGDDCACAVAAGSSAPSRSALGALVLLSALAYGARRAATIT